MTPAFQKILLQTKKNCASIQLSKKNLFITKRKVPTQPRIPQVNCCFFVKEKNRDRGFPKNYSSNKKIMDRAAALGPSLSKRFISQKNVDRAVVFQNNLFPTKKEVPTWHVLLVNFCLLKKRPMRPGLSKNSS